MPSYINHIITNFAIALILLFFYQKNPFLTDTQLALSLLGYFLGTVILTPDLDTRSEPSRRCGIVCKPLTALSKHHGIQHHWLYGTLLRVIYITIIISILLLIIYGLPSIPNFISILSGYKLEILFIIIGLFLSNLFHIILDAVSNHRF